MVSTSQGGVVTQAVNDVVAAGALYFTAAGNQGSLDASTSGTYEGDFVPQAAASPLPAGNVHNFGGGNGFDTVTSPGEQVVGLYWSDPLGGSGNDYDLYLLNSTGTSILGASTNIQNGTQDPVELIGSANVINNNRLVVFQHTGAANRFFHLELFRGRLAVATSGETHGHAAASGAYTVAATPASVSAGLPTPNGPFPLPFNASSQTEFFTSDGLRQIFFNGDSTAITPGNFSSTGGQILNKPDITAADGVSVTGVGGFGSPFFGTDAAAPAAAAVAALVLAAQPTLTAVDMRTALTSTAVDIMGVGYDRDSGSGIVMAWEAINSLGVTGLADPALGTITANENPGNGNGVIEPGEGASMVIALNNLGGAQAATAVTATLTTSTPNVFITQPATSAYADIPVGSSGGNNLQRQPITDRGGS
ncbi:MAG TPA: S8 family serine peptidase [Candidatus Sulfotelmatobacter sp.]|nr:S8 family serine peptidase [Candidatus Sulfotelmatobacter sp.]